MPEEDAVEEASEPSPGAQSPASPQHTRSSSIPLFLSSLALLLAAFALTVALISSKNINAHRSLSGIKGKLNVMEGRMNHVETLMATDKRGMVQAELKKMLLNLHELSRLGDDKTRAEIAKAEAVLQRLSTPETRIRIKVDLKRAMQPGRSDKPEASATEVSASKPVPANPEKILLNKTANKPSPDAATGTTPALSVPAEK